MTEREAQILKWIADDPFISQQEIARRAGITRSSAAVHISNLMRKGKIKGKGYILQESTTITVVGGVNVDIVGTPYAALIEQDSNPGRVEISYGGVGRNIAENLTRLGVPVELITVLGDDLHAQEIRSSCGKLGIGLRHAMRAPGQNTSTYLCLNNADGEMKLAVSDMGLYDRLTPDYLQGKLDAVNRSQLVVMDTNISEEAIGFLAENCTVPIFADPVSTQKAVKLKKHLGKIHTLKPNRIEAELLTGVKIFNKADLTKAANEFLRIGVKNIFLSLGQEGVFYADSQNQGLLPCSPANIVNTTGCGDAFLAAAAWAFSQDWPIQQAARAGLAASALCLEASAAVSTKLNIEAIEHRMNV